MKNNDHNPTDIAALFNKACEQHQNKNFPEAEKLYLELLNLLKDNWYLHYNYGLLLFETDNYDHALEQYLTAFSIAPDDNDLLHNLGLCQKQCGLYQDAIESYRRALAFDPEDIDCLYNLAGCYSEINDFDTAVSIYKTLLNIQPDHQSALNNIAYICHKIGNVDQAIIFYSRLLEINPQNQSAEHMLASLSGDSKTAAPHSYIREVFDNYSDHYEDSLLNKLHYSLPARLQGIVKDVTGRQCFNRLLDLGCGTGLVGETFRQVTGYVHGIDLSPRMVSVARDKKCYNKLSTGDILSTVVQCKKEFYDLVIAADVFAYIGELRELFHETLKICMVDGYFFFSVEDLSLDKQSFLLQMSGRFAHSRAYIQLIAHETGWSIIDVRSLNLRKERNAWIKGAVYALQKSHEIR